MTTPILETAQDVFHWFEKLRENPSLNEADWLALVADFIIETGDTLHDKARELLMEAFGDLLANR